MKRRIFNPLFITAVIGLILGCVALFTVLRDAWSAGGTILFAAWLGVGIGSAVGLAALHFFDNRSR